LIDTQYVTTAHGGAKTWRFFYAVADWIIGNHVIHAAHTGGYFCATAYMPTSVYSPYEFFSSF